MFFDMQGDDYMSIYILSITFSVLFIIIVLDLVRRQKLKEQYSILWVLVSLLLAVVSVDTRILEWLALNLDVAYAPAILFLFGLIFCFTFILHLTTVVSKLNDRVLRLAQELALLKGNQSDE